MAEHGVYHSGNIKVDWDCAVGFAGVPAFYPPAGAVFADPLPCSGRVPGEVKRRRLGTLDVSDVGTTAANRR